jgi:F-type H+-transporting ATPase subunit b
MASGPDARALETERHPAINWTQFGGAAPPFIAMVINFAILVAGYVLLGRKPVSAALIRRRDTIAKDIDEAQRMKREAEERAKTYQAKLERLDHEMRTAREALVRAGQAEGDRIVAEARARAELLRKEAEFLVEQELKQMRQDLWRDAVDTAVAAAAELLRQQITPTDHERIAEEYLAEIAPESTPSRPRPEAREAVP